jgi:hypothetical protein
MPHVPIYPQIPRNLADPIMRTVRKPSLSEKEIMRKNRIKLTLIIASLCGTCSSVNTLGQDYSTSGPISSVGRIGDGGVQSSAAEAAFARDARPAAFRSNVVADNGMGQSYSDTPVSYSEPSSEYVESYTVAPRSTAGYSSSSSGWFESETLLWWPKGVSGSPFVVGGNSPIETRPTNPLAGGPNNQIGSDLLVGMRLNVGAWTDCNQNFGIGARGWGLLSDGRNQTYNNGANSLGVPFFNTSVGLLTPGPDVYLVNISEGANGANTGTIQVKDDLDLISSEIYGRALLLREGSSRVDLLVGYTFVRLDSEFGLRTSYTDGITNATQNGTVITTQDTFGTKNQFHGGHLGFLHEISKGRFTFSGLGKVALGNIHQSSTISGQSTETAPGQAAVVTGQGLFAQNSNIGTLTRDQFTFLPEAGAKLKYKLRGAELGLGYTLLVFPSVATAGGQVDRNVDRNPFVAGQPVAPAARLATETFFLHGLDLGVTFKF